jgi:hypothetical protein
MYLTAGSTGQGVTGNIQVRSSASPPQTFQFTGFVDLTLDLIVRPSDPFGVLVELQPGDAAGYIGFHEVTYTTL